MPTDTSDIDDELAGLSLCMNRDMDDGGFMQKICMVMVD